MSIQQVLVVEIRKSLLITLLPHEQWFSKCGLQTISVGITPGNLLEMSILGPLARPTELETLEFPIQQFL